MIKQLTDTVSVLDRRVAEFEGQARLLEQQLAAARSREEAAGEEVALHDQALAAFDQLVERWRVRTEERVSSLITHGLAAVFSDDSISVSVETTTKRDTAHMRFLLRQGGIELGNLIDGTGGSIVSVFSFLFRVVVTMHEQPPLRRVMLMDETFRMIAPDHMPALGSLLRELSDRLGFQFVLVSHEQELLDAADVVIEVTKHGDTASVREIKSANEERH